MDGLPEGRLAFNLTETAALLGVTRKTVRGMVDRGELPCVKYASKRWVPRHALLALMGIERLAS